MGVRCEEESREILENVLTVEEPRAPNLAQAIARHIEPLGGIELRLPKKQAIRCPPALS